MQPQQNEAAALPLNPYQYPRAVSNPMARDFVLWSLFNFTTCNCCCLGLLALVFSIKSRDRKVLGDPEGAANYGRTAKYLNIAAVTITLIIYLILLIVLISSALLIINAIFDIMKLPDETEYSGK